MDRSPVVRVENLEALDPSGQFKTPATAPSPEFDPAVLLSNGLHITSGSDCHSTVNAFNCRLFRAGELQVRCLGTANWVDVPTEQCVGEIKPRVSTPGDYCLSDAS